MYHQPVLLFECIESLNINPNGVYVDVTFGGGGHSALIMKHLDKGRLLAFDQDPDAGVNEIKDDRFTFIPHNFKYLQKFCRLSGVLQVDGILADLGVSSHQFDRPERGFSTRHETEIDMRMDTNLKVSGKEIINTYSKEDLHRILGVYGEVRNAKALAQKIVLARLSHPIRTVSELKRVVLPFAEKGRENHYLAQVFQAVRIEVNQELEALKELLNQSAQLIKPGGRLVVVSYHSLEDRLVKNYIHKGKFKGEMDKDLYGNTIRPFEPVVHKVIRPSEQEIKQNNRARSAKLRIGIKR